MLKSYLSSFYLLGFKLLTLSLKVYNSKFKVLMCNARIKHNPNKTHPFTKSHKSTPIMQVQNIIYRKSSNSKF